jgi:hypothetical protein
MNANESGDGRRPGCLQKLTNENLGGHSDKSPLHHEYLAVVNEAQVVIQTVLELSLEPASGPKAVQLKVTARELKRRCNRLAHELLGKRSKP